MRYFDVVFPLNLGPLTYEASESSSDAVRPGMLVEAEIKKSLKRGIVLRPASVAAVDRIKPIAGVVGDGPVLGEEMLKLLVWMAGYYFASEGSVLKGALPGEFFNEVKPRGKAHAVEVKCPPSAYGLDDTTLGAIEELRADAGKKKYGSFLLHAPSTGHESAFLLKTIEGLRNVLVLVPDHAEIRLLEGVLKERFGDRFAVYHSGLSKGRRSDALRRITSGEADVVLGSRSAVFAPMMEVSLIAVLREESALYKAESGARYNARDVAVMRGFLSGATVLLSSICPSVESYHNAQKGKYKLIEAASSPGTQRPRVRVMDMWKSRTTISGRLKGAAEAALKRGERAMIYVNRRGYSMLHCDDCGHMEACPRCQIPLVFYKTEKSLRCNYCGSVSSPPRTCPGCGGPNMGPVGTGIERVEEELAALHPVGVDSKSRGRLKVLTEGEGGLAVGTKLLTRRSELSAGFSVAGVVDADAYCYLPDFRSTERAFQDLCYMADRVSPGGQLIVQSRRPRARLFEYLRRFDFRRFYRDELAQREELRYPPFSRMALLTVDSQEEPRAPLFRGVEVLGPVPALTKRGRKVWKVLVKAPSMRELQPAVRSILKRLKGRKATVDVDPAAV